MPLNLLVTRRRQDMIMPVYSELNSNNTMLAKHIIDVYSENVGQKKLVLNNVVSEFEDWGYDYRFVRGLAALLDRRCQLETKTSVDPIDVRRRLFHVSCEEGLPTSGEERYAILSRVAAELKLDADTLEESIYGDLEDEMVLTSFDPIDPVDLLRQYNLSLTQTLLFNASELSFTASGNWQRIFRQIKWLGLIYTVRPVGVDYWVTIDGPVSLFKLTRRYGTSLARLLPSVTGNRAWRLKAKVIGPAGNTLLNLELDSIRHGSYMKQPTGEEEPIFDSGVEEDFAKRFEALGTGWALIREPGPLPVGEYVMIPDFLFEKDGLKVYLEIVGFWTPEYLDDKLRKLDAARGVDMVVAVDRRLACRIPSGRLEHLSLIHYKDRVPLKPILTHLQDRQRVLVDREVESVQDTELNLASPVVGVEEIADVLGISVEAAKSMMVMFSAPGYRRLGDIFVRETLLTTMGDALRSRLASGRLSLHEASQLIESLGGRDPSAILEALGYRIIWHGINPESAEISENRPI